MRKLKDSGIEWIGKIPENWKVQRAKTLFSQRLTKGNQDITLLAATQKYGMLPQSEVEGVVQVKENADLQQFRTVHKDDYVISLRSFQGGFEFSQYEGVCSPAYQVFYNIKPVYHPYYRLMFKSDGFIKKMNSLTVGIRDGKNIQYDDFANSLIPVPPLDEQEHIASYLDRKCSQIDAIISKQQQIIEKLKEYKLSIITEAVTKGLDPNVPMKDSGVEWIGMVPERWKVGQLKYFATIRAGLTLGKKYEIDAKLVEMPYLRVANVQGEYVDLSDVSSVSVLPEEVEKYSLHKNELLMTEGGDKDKLGRGCVWNGEIDPCLHQNHVFAVATDAKKLSIHFLSYLTTSGVARSYFEYTAKKTTNLASTNSTIILQFKLPIPSIQEQGDIICYLDKCCKQINTLIHEKENILSKINEYKKALIYEVVTGKKEVL